MTVLAAGGGLAECNDDGPVVADALMLVVWRRGKSDAVMYHSDRGSYQRAIAFRSWCLVLDEPVRNV